MSEPGAWADLDDEQPVDAAAEPTTYYASVDEFFRHFLRPVYRRPINARTTFWAADWWRHPEAVLRLDAMWRSWEQARLDPANGMATWLRDVADYHMGVLMSPQGPFGTSQDTCDPGDPLPYAQPPPALFSSLTQESRRSYAGEMMSRNGPSTTPDPQNRRIA